MTFNEVMKQLESLGTEQNRKTCARHGAGENTFGVSFANLGKLQKQIKTDHDLAVKLMESGNTDAMTLAMMIADPQKVTAKQLDEWAKASHYHCFVDVFAGFAAKTLHARKKMEAWTKSKDEFIGQAGWNLLSHLAMKNPELDDDYLKDYLEIIRTDIHNRKNRTRYAMNIALISIGIRNSALQKLALAAAKEIGKVEVDHGDTSCKTPDAVEYILKTVNRKASKQAKKSK